MRRPNHTSGIRVEIVLDRGRRARSPPIRPGCTLADAAARAEKCQLMIVLKDLPKGSDFDGLLGRSMIARPSQG